MKVIIISILISIIFTAEVTPQINTDSVFNLAISYRGLSKEDITIPVNFDKEKSPRNNSRLILPEVKEMMHAPLEYEKFTDSISSLSDKSEIEIISYFLKLLNVAGTSFQSIKLPDKFSGNDLVKTVQYFKNKNEKLNSAFSNEEKKFLSGNILSLVLNTGEFEGSSMDVFKYNKARDSGNAVSKKTLDILSRINMDSIMINSVNAFSTCLVIYNTLKEKGFIENADSENYGYENSGYIFYYDKAGIRIAIGGYENNVYEGHYDLIIDFGGDDVYNLSAPKDIFRNGFNCIMDLSGNDFYYSNSDFTLAGGAFSSGFIFDRKGDDVYKGKNISLGSAVGGIAFLCDEDGNDIYQSGVLSQAAASFGIGILYDKNGNDFYNSNSYSQGFGMTNGTGAIIDLKGNDSYMCDARSLDIGRYEDHFISMSQGFGLGLRPFYAGGIGVIIESEGNDIYGTDIYGQGSAYWYGIGCITDKKGNDKYNSYQYSQGAGIHLAVGILKDEDGWDFYTSNGVSQGCGHDFGIGILDDLRGNDNYSAYSLSQGAGNANGIGIFLDKNGRDGYLNKEPENTRGYGNPRRDFGSIGLFIDYSGKDFYSVPGKDSVISNSSTWGTMLDFYPADITETGSANDFKIPVDSNREYTLDEYFIMAKTIEPRFSLWQEFGFSKLVNDSEKTAEFVLKFLDTDDHREALVLRNLAFKIGYTMGKLFSEKLKFHLVNMHVKPEFNEDQIAFICYLFGETGNPEGKEELLQLMPDGSMKVKTSAVNALGKIRLTDEDNNFKERVSERLRDLAFSDSESKLLNKDVSFAFKKYMLKENIPALMHLLGSGYFGARFNAAECLKKYGDEYSGITENIITRDKLLKLPYGISYAESLRELQESKFKQIFESLSGTTGFSDIPFRLKLLELIKYRQSLSTDNAFKDWCNSMIELINVSDFKIVN